MKKVSCLEEWKVESLNGGFQFLFCFKRLLWFLIRFCIVCQLFNFWNAKIGLYFRICLPFQTFQGSFFCFYFEIFLKLFQYIELVAKWKKSVLIFSKLKSCHFKMKASLHFRTKMFKIIFEKSTKNQKLHRFNPHLFHPQIKYFCLHVTFDFSTLHQSFFQKIFTNFTSTVHL